MFDGCVSLLQPRLLPLDGGVQVVGGDEGKCHGADGLLCTAPGLLDEGAHGVSCDGLLNGLADLLS